MRRDSGDFGSSPGSDREAALRTSGAVTIGWVAVVAAALVAVLILAQVPAVDAVAMLGLPAVIAAVGWACYLRPRVLLEEHGARIINLVRTHDVPFARIDSVDHRLGVTLTTDAGRRIAVWSLPDTGRRVRRAGLHGGSVEPHTAEPVQRLLDARARWLQADQGPIGPQEVTSRTDVRPALVCAVVALWAVWGLIVTAGF